MNPTENGFEDERTRLQAEIGVAQDRIVAARARAQARDSAGRDALRAEIVAARERVADLERQHTEALLGIRLDAEAEVRRILSEACRIAGENVASINTTDPALAPDVG